MAMSRMTEQIGRVLGGRYRLLAPIGRGASAQVFVADDVRLRRRVAVKVLHDALAADDGFLHRFRAEAQAAAALNHPHVMAVYDWGQDGDDSPWIVSEYLGGGSVRGLLDRGHRLTPSQALVVALQAARGLEYAHRRGFVHRDVKPANLLFGDEGRLRIADFGLARALAEAAWTEPQGAVVGTARYASPEQAQGMALTGRSDVYSLALVVVETVTGEVPFATDTTLGTLMARVDRPLVAAEALGPLAAPVEAAGVPDPDERLDARGLVAALARVAPELPRPRPVPLVGAVDVDLTDDRDPTAVVGRDGPPAPDDGPEVPAFVRAAPWRPPGDDGPADDAGGADPDPDADPTRVVAGPAAAPATGRAGGPPRSPRGTSGGDAGLTDHEVDDDALEDEDEGEPWDPRSPTGRRRRWPARLLGLVALLVVGGVVALLVADLLRGPPTTPVPTVTGLSVAQARADLADLGWEVTVEEVRRDGTAAGEVLGTRPARGARLEEGAGVTLVVSAGATLVDRPAVAAGMPVEEALGLLAAAGLRADVERAFDEEVPAEVVVAVDPDLPARVERGTTVALVVSDGPEPRTVPVDLVGGDGEAAVSALADLGLAPEVEEAFSDDVAAGLVIEVDPGEGTEVPRGAAVTVVVSLGPDLVTVPDVRGAASLAAAVEALEAAGLEAGEVRGPAAGAPAGTVPAVGQEVRRGASVDIVLE